MAAEAALEYGGLLAAGYSLYQAKQLHNVEHDRARARHEEAIRLAVEQHQRDLKTVKQTYLMEIFNNLEQHFQQLNADLIASSKESERDMFDQRNQSFQTIILASSVMFSALSTVIVQGFLPLNTSFTTIYVLYSLTSALSFAFLFLCIVICIEVLMRASTFMYERAHNHTTHLKTAIDKTKRMMRKLRGEPSAGSSENLSALGGEPPANRPDQQQQDEDEGGEAKSGLAPAPEIRRSPALSLVPPELTSPSSYSYGHANGNGNGNGKSTPVPTTRPGLGKPTASGVTGLSDVGRTSSGVTSTSNGRGGQTYRRVISKMEPDEIEREWNRHELEIQNYLEERERINDQTTILASVDDPTSVRKSFQQFWKESCKAWAELAVLFFYAGSAFLLLATLIFMWAQFFNTYNSLAGAVIAVVLIGLSLVVGIAIVILLRIHNEQNAALRRTEDPRNPAAQRPSLSSAGGSQRDLDRIEAGFSTRSSRYSADGDDEDEDEDDYRDRRPTRGFGGFNVRLPGFGRAASRANQRDQQRHRRVPDEPVATAVTAHPVEI